MKAARIPLAQPRPPRLSEAADALRAIEASNLFSNFGPVNTHFEQSVTHSLFGGVGESLTVCNATIGLMIAIREAIEAHPDPRRRYALMPSFTFAAAAQAALWNQLTPLFCDINRSDWSADPSSELELLEKYKDQIAVIVPYATFGYDIDLAWYENLQEAYGIPVVVDAAASLGTISSNGKGFGTGFSGSVIYSMHATKSFATGEGGLIYSGSAERIRTLRTMSNFGFSEPRNATMMGLNAKMSEVAALLACLRLGRLRGRDAEAVAHGRSLPQPAARPDVSTGQVAPPGASIHVGPAACRAGAVSRAHPGGTAGFWHRYRKLLLASCGRATAFQNHGEVRIAGGHKRDRVARDHAAAVRRHDNGAGSQGVCRGEQGTHVHTSQHPLRRA